MIRKLSMLFLKVMLLLNSITLFGQGFNHVGLLGTDTGFPMGRIEFDTNSYSVIQAQRKMTFKGTEATICDFNGNFLMSSNGVWIANANNDTMMNGAGLNPSWDVNAFPKGLLNINGNLIVPYPSDSLKYLLFHEAQLFSSSYLYGIYQSIIDISLDSGLGGVILKNDTLLIDSISMGLAACKHGNGRDWWLVAQKDSSDTLFIFLLTPYGITALSKQSLGYSPFAKGNGSEITFSQDGTKLIVSNTVQPQKNSFAIICDFDRCSGMFSNTQIVPLTTNGYLWGLAFSPSGQYAYGCSSNYIFQINTSTLLVDTVATYDGFCYPNAPWCTTFWNMYLAANGKIYITSGNAVQHIHEMNFPDNAGLSCDVQQHAINLNGIWYLRAAPNHPNYYLGRLVGSPCDTVWQGIKETQHDFRFRIYPNPITNNNLHIGYLLPQNKSGLFLIYDVTGKVIFKYTLPPWSNEQTFNLPSLSNGVYNCVITSNNYRATKKLVVIKE